MTETPLDTAFAVMEATPADDAARLRFYDRLSNSELFLMLASEPEGDSVLPEIFDLQEARFVLVFDLEERLSAFAGRVVPYAAMSGRALAQMLAGQGIGLALNPDTAPSATLLPPDALDWLTGTLQHAPQEAEARPERLGPPRDLPQALLTALDARLAAAAGLARRAYLAEVVYRGGTRGHLLGITGAVDSARPALAKAIQEALVFSGLEAGALDVTFLSDSDPLTSELARVGLRFDLPEPDPTARARPLPAAPGSDPDKPPRLR